MIAHVIVFQIIFSIFALGAISGVLKKYRSGELGVLGTSFWVIFWVGALLAVLWPHGTTIVANLFGIGRGADFIFYVSIILIFFVLFRLHVKIENVNRDITKIVRQMAIDKESKK